MTDTRLHGLYSMERVDYIFDTHRAAQKRLSLPVTVERLEGGQGAYAVIGEARLEKE